MGGTSCYLVVAADPHYPVAARSHFGSASVLHSPVAAADPHYPEAASSGG